MEFGGLSQSCGNASALAPQKQRTKPLIPEMCFTSTGCSTDINLSTPYLEEDGTSLLVSCKKCSVRVHASECLALRLRPDPGHWACSRLVLPHVGLSPACQVPPQALKCKDCSWVVGEFAADGVGVALTLESTLCCSLGHRYQEAVRLCCSPRVQTREPMVSDFSRLWVILYG